ncbi:hypothetical protein D3C73_473970 [compost metagenome]
MKYVPKRDIWLSIVIWSSIALLLACGTTPFFVEGSGIIGGAFIAGFCFLIAAFLTWLWVASYYVLKDNSLFIRSGPITKSISYDLIVKVKPVRSWLASAATSSRRLEIQYGKYEVIHISPLNEAGFLSEIRKKCPEAQIEERRD